MDYQTIRERFIRYVFRNWQLVDEKVGNTPCTYIMIAYCPMSNIFRLAYVGSTKRLRVRLKSHEVPPRIKNKGWINIVYFKPMKKGYYDYEMKIIGRLKPFFNIQHKTNA